MSRSNYSAQFSLSPSTAPPATTTITLDTPSSSNQPQQQQITDSLVLKLKPPKKKVSWKEGTVDNEFMNKKSSKKCCIFHKEKPFDEDDSDSEGDCNHESDRNSAGKDNFGEDNHNHEGDGSCCHGP